MFTNGQLAEQYEQEDVSESLMDRLKVAVVSSRQKIRELYEGHCESVRKMTPSPYRRKIKT